MNRCLALVALATALTPRAAAAEGDRAVAGSATLYGYVAPDQPDFLMLVAPVDVRRRLHLEGRYNYESLRTGALFFGMNGEVGERVRLRATGMMGGVFGQVFGVAPGVRLVLTTWKLDLFVEAEYVLDVLTPSASFFYAWSELGLSPLPWARVCLVAQRTHVFRNDLEIQRGLCAGVHLFDRVDLTAYELNLGWAAPIYVGAVAVSY
jgi:hypothetical protein